MVGVYNSLTIPGILIVAEREVQLSLIMQGKFRAGETVLSQDVITFLENWLIKHIKGTDKKYGPHLNKNGVR